MKMRNLKPYSKAIPIIASTIKWWYDFSKKNLKKGIRHRWNYLGLKNQSDDFFRITKEEYRRADVGEDDIVDSMVLAYYAKQSVEKGIKIIPNEVEYDSQLTCAIHFV